MPAYSMPWPRAMQPARTSRLALRRLTRYSATVVANSATGFGDPINIRRTGAPITIAGAFFVPARPCYGGCAWETFGSAGFLMYRFANLRTAATLIRLATDRGSSTHKERHPMHTLNPSALQNHIAALKARAIAALHANSSLSVRLARYNAAMARARALEVNGGAQ